MYSTVHKLQNYIYCPAVSVPGLENDFDFIKLCLLDSPAWCTTLDAMSLYIWAIQLMRA